MPCYMFAYTFIKIDKFKSCKSKNCTKKLPLIDVVSLLQFVRTTPLDFCHPQKFLMLERAFLSEF